MNRPCGIITLLTDFADENGYTAAMKGVILRINPQAYLVDVSHQIARHDLLQAALILRNVCPFFPPGSVHLVVVDPGVGGKRKALVAETEVFTFVGPDNGVLAPVLELFPPLQVVAIENPRYVMPRISDTFHGRDIFAPVAAHCSLGVSVREFGSPARTHQTLEIPQPALDVNRLSGQVVAVDHFGNVVTNISRQDLETHFGTDPVVVQLGETIIEGLSRSYQQVPPGAPLAVIGSWEMLEIAVNGGDARSALGAGRGDVVVVRRRSGG